MKDRPFSFDLRCQPRNIDSFNCIVAYNRRKFLNSFNSLGLYGRFFNILLFHTALNENRNYVTGHLTITIFYLLPKSPLKAKICRCRS
jgi:hypothetical protein